MRKLKLIVLIIAILLVQGLAFGDEIVEKEGNTTTIKLTSEDSTNFNKLFGDTPTTATHNYSYYSNKATTIVWKYYRGNTYSESTVHGEIPSHNYKDSNQNLATLSTNSEIVMKQDDEYYYYDMDLNSNSEIVPYDYTKTTGDTYQQMNVGTLYLSNIPINNLGYTYSKSFTFNNNFLDKYPVGSGGSAYYQNKKNYIIDESLSLNINGTQTTQKMKNVSNYEYSYNAGTTADTNTFTKDDTGVSSSTNNTNKYYISYTFPFENLLNGITGIANYNLNINYYDISEYCTKGLANTLKTKLLFTNGQSNFTMPKKLTYNPIVSVNHTQNKDLTYWNDKIIARIKIKKSDIENFHYLNLYAPTAVSYNINGTPFNYSTTNDINDNTYHDDRNTTISHGVQDYYSIHSGNAIDLLPYTNCEHNWVLQSNNNKNTHEMYCSKCDWHKQENHDLKYEYDGILNNACMCGYVDKVNYHFAINDNTTRIINATYNSYDNYTKYEAGAKTGYKFKWYEKYEKRFLDETDLDLSETNTKLKEIFIATTSILTDMTNKYSTTYKAIYEPIKYKFKFSNINNKGLILKGNIEPQTFYYGTNQEIKDSIKVEGYGLKGWSLTEGSDSIDFTPNQIILNYTTIDNTEYTLYPVYDELIFKIVLSTDKGSFSNGQKVKVINYSMEDVIDYEKPTIPDNVITETKGKKSIDITTKYTFKNYIGLDNTVFNNANDIRKYIFEKGIYNYILYLTANIDEQTNRPYTERSSGGGNSGGGNINKKIDISNLTPIYQKTDEINADILNVVNENLLKTTQNKTKIKNKDIIDMLAEIYVDWKEQNNINDKRKFDIVDLIKAIYEDFNSSHD